MDCQKIPSIEPALFSHAKGIGIVPLLYEHFPIPKKKGMAGSMNQEEQWNRFAATGKVTDYLEYRKNAGRERNSVSERSRKNERNSYTYRNDFNSISNERVR